MNRRDFLLRSGAFVALGLLPRTVSYGQAGSSGQPQPAAPAGAAPVRPPTVATEFKALRRNTGLFTGRGGTIGWLVNADAVVAVDTQFPDTAALFLGGLPGRSGRTLDVVLDTHHHWDHTGGNKVFKAAARRIVGHVNVPGLQVAALARNPQIGEQTPPDTLFADSWRVEAGDEVISARHFGPAHTGGDIVVHFERANVVHVGDLVFNRIYPVTDRPGGCRIRGWITALEEVAKAYPADAVFIFGHGRQTLGLSGTLGDVLAQRDFLTALVSRAEQAVKSGEPRAELTKLINLPGFPDYEADAKTSRLPGNLGAAYDELTGAPA